MHPILFIALLTLAACAAPAKAPKVLIIGVDGLRPDQLQQAHTPAMDHLVGRGAVSYDARNAWTPTHDWNGHSATNWGVLLSGVSPTRTELTANGDAEHWIRDAPDGAGFRSVFGHAKARDPGLQTAVFNTWHGIGMEPGTILGACASSVDHHFSSHADTSSAERDVETTLAAVEALLGTGRFHGADPDLVFVHLSQVDSAGHSFTYDDPRYRAAIEVVDQRVQELLDAVGDRPRRSRERWLFLLSTDHGGESESTGHADNSQPLVHTIPFVLAGDGIAAGANLGQPSLYDIAPTALAWLGIEVAQLGFDGNVLPR